MEKLRLIARLDIKNEYVIKGIHLEGLRKIGDPIQLAKKYYDEGIDEIIFMDAVASLYGRNNLFHIIEKACEQVFVPITIGGGIRTLEDIGKALKAGADKIALNTSAVRNPDFVTEASRIFGSQCIVGSIEAKHKGNSWEAYVDNGREETGLNAVEWAKRLEDLGCGEIMITSVDRDGTMLGFDLNLISNINDNISIPLIACSGAGTIAHFVEIASKVRTGGIATASALHYNRATIPAIKAALREHGNPMR
ncbi:MAG: imidazole glycerol phosphate synthase cyclase subunit [Bacteroidota bacterium]|jgi:cyclase|nr:MAG: imidazole glycerol phosphate synthase subunit HisF [Bacteroidota bacterium]